MKKVKLRPSYKGMEILWKIEITEQVLEEISLSQDIKRCPLLKKKRRTREGNLIKVREEQSIELKVLMGPEGLGSKNKTEDQKFGQNLQVFKDLSKILLNAGNS